jgi:pyruvate/2-oxoglutarate dehydrogenase complex dihydrolipoamide acyltransferase (E2) component
MNQINGHSQVVDLSRERRGMAAFLALKEDRHIMYALLEVDVTLAKQFIEAYKAKTGEALSFTGFLASCLARAVDEDKTIQAYRKGSKKLILFEDVDVGFMIELKKGEKKVLRGHVIRAANHKTFWQIHQEIREVQSSRVPVEEETVSWFRSALLLPWPLSRLFAAAFRWAMRNDPTIVTSMAGTVGISSVGMFGKGHGGWGMATGTHGLDLVVGGTARKPAVVDGRIEPRELLDLTIIFDHDVVDGAPAARFTKKLVELIESGYGLEEQQETTGSETLVERANENEPVEEPSPLPA